MEDPIEQYAPDVATAMSAVSNARVALDIDMADPGVELFADQFGVDVTLIDDDIRRRFLEATGPTALEVAQAVYVDDYWPRIAAMAMQLLGVSMASRPAERVAPVELWPLVEEFHRAVARLDAVDPVTTELVRLRGARQHQCRLGRSRRSLAAIEQGADEATFDAVDRYAHSDLPEHAKAALGIADAMIWSPYAVPRELVEAAAGHLSPAQVIEVVLDVARDAADKIAVALGSDAATVADGVELFTTDADGNLTVVGPQPR